MANYESEFAEALHNDPTYIDAVSAHAEHLHSTKTVARLCRWVSPALPWYAVDIATATVAMAIADGDIDVEAVEQMSVVDWCGDIDVASTLDSAQRTLGKQLLADIG